MTHSYHTRRSSDLEVADQLIPADVRHLDIHHDQIGRERARALDGIAAVAHRLGDELMRPQQITEQLEIEFVVLDNEHPFCQDRKSTRLNQSLMRISYAVLCLKKKNHKINTALRYNNHTYCDLVRI